MEWSAIPRWFLSWENLKKTTDWLNAFTICIHYIFYIHLCDEAVRTISANLWRKWRMKVKVGNVCNNEECFWKRVSLLPPWWQETWAYFNLVNIGVTFQTWKYYWYWHQNNFDVDHLLILNNCISNIFWREFTNDCEHGLL